MTKSPSSILDVRCQVPSARRQLNARMFLEPSPKLAGQHERLSGLEGPVAERDAMGGRLRNDENGFACFSRS